MDRSDLAVALRGGGRAPTVLAARVTTVRIDSTWKARAAYVRRLYRVDPADASLYHMVIDSTAIPLDTVIELILTAARSHHGESISESGART